VSKLFLAQVRKVKYKQVLIHNSYISFDMQVPTLYKGNIICIAKVSLDEFSDHIKYSRANGIEFEVSGFMLDISLALTNRTLRVLSLLSKNNRFDFDTLKLYHQKFDTQKISRLHQRVYTYIATLRFFCLDDERYSYSKDDAFSYCPPSLQIKELSIYLDNIEKFGSERLNQHTHVEKINFEWNYKFTNEHLRGLTLQLKSLGFNSFYPFNMSTFSCSINSLTRLEICVFENYTDFLSFLPLLVNLEVLKAACCDKVPFDYFQKLIKVVCSLKNIVKLTVCDNCGMFSFNSGFVNWEFNDNQITMFSIRLDHCSWKTNFNNFVKQCVRHYVDKTPKTIFGGKFAVLSIPFSIFKGTHQHKNIVYDDKYLLIIGLMHRNKEFLVTGKMVV